MIPPSSQLPPPNIELDLEDYARLSCLIMDIPVYDELPLSLHVLFALYMEFKNNPHFQQQKEISDKIRKGEERTGREREKNI